MQKNAVFDARVGEIIHLPFSTRKKIWSTFPYLLIFYYFLTLTGFVRVSFYNKAVRCLTIKILKERIQKDEQQNFF